MSQLNITELLGINFQHIFEGDVQPPKKDIYQPLLYCTKKCMGPYLEVQGRHKNGHILDGNFCGASGDFECSKPSREIKYE